VFVTFSQPNVIKICWVTLHFVMLESKLIINLCNIRNLYMGWFLFYSPFQNKIFIEMEFWKFTQKSFLQTHSWAYPYGRVHKGLQPCLKMLEQRGSDWQFQTHYPTSFRDYIINYGVKKFTIKTMFGYGSDKFLP
jgi:hypothetical protein